MLPHERGGAPPRDVSRKPRGRRARRSTETIVELIVAAAIEEFEEKSYLGATTAGIARRAGVAEALLFNHFGSKAQLFHQTVFKSLDSHFDAFLAERADGTADQLQSRANTRAYIDALQGFVAEHSGLFLSLIFTQTYQAGEVKGLAGIKGLPDYFSRLAALAEQRIGESPRVSSSHMAGISFATILSSVLFRDWLFPEDDDAESLRRAISDFVMEGLSANEPGPQPPEAARRPRSRRG